jgi:hypothetical protein
VWQRTQKINYPSMVFAIWPITSPINFSPNSFAEMVCSLSQVQALNRRLGLQKIIYMVLRDLKRGCLGAKWAIARDFWKVSLCTTYNLQTYIYNLPFIAYKLPTWRICRRLRHATEDGPPSTEG